MFSLGYLRNVILNAMDFTGQPNIYYVNLADIPRFFVAERVITELVLSGCLVSGESTTGDYQLLEGDQNKFVMAVLRGVASAEYSAFRRMHINMSGYFFIAERVFDKLREKSEIDVSRSEGSLLH